MKIGVPSEVKNNEFRVGLTPNSCRAIIGDGHSIFIQNNAGFGIGYTNEDYIKSGALILDTAEEVYLASELKRSGSQELPGVPLIFL